MQLVTDEGEQFPLASEALELNSYVDDIITGAKDLSSAVQVQDELISLLGKGGFTLHKWHSNDQEVLSRIPDEKRESCSFQFPDGSFTLKTLGLFWNPTSDVFLVTVPNEIMNIEHTKRNILSVISKIYDPLGLVSVVVIKAKIIMQSLWKVYCWLPMTRRRPPPQSWARPGQDGERRINVILNHKATVLFPKKT
jgi:hypothetical protein